MGESKRKRRQIASALPIFSAIPILPRSHNWNDDRTSSQILSSCNFSFTTGNCSDPDHWSGSATVAAIPPLSCQYHDALSLGCDEVHHQLLDGSEGGGGLAGGGLVVVGAGSGDVVDVPESAGGGGDGSVLRVGSAAWGPTGSVMTERPSA